MSFLPRYRATSLPPIHEYFHEFANSDVSRVEGFYPIPHIINLNRRILSY
jgi:hypothetical protein